MRKTLIVIKKLFIVLVFSQEVFLTGCVNTEGTLKIKGKVLDENTKTGIPLRGVVVQGLVNFDNKLVPIEAGQFSTDSSGSFTYSLKKIKDAYFYNFCPVGDSDYLSKTRYLGLYELEQNANSLSISLSRLVDLTIKIYRESKKPVFDTLSLSWESNGVSCWSLYPYKITNFGKTLNYSGLTSATELCWIGGSINSTVKTRVFADKRTKLYWDLIRNGKRKEIFDTITCRRDFVNTVYFTY
jgi:hypothetical protein